MKTQSNGIPAMNAIKRLLKVGSTQLIEKSLRNGDFNDEMLLDQDTNILTYVAELGRTDVCNLLLTYHFEPYLTREIKSEKDSVSACLNLISSYRNGENIEELSTVLPGNIGSLKDQLTLQREKESFHFDETFEQFDNSKGE